MDRKNTLTRILAILGITLVALTILAPLVFALAALFRRGRFLFDYLMPAELFPVALGGGLPLLWAAMRTKSRRGMISWGLVAAAGFLIASQLVAVVTGLASGVNETAGWRFVLVISLLVAYILAVITLGVGGGLLLKDLFSPSHTPPKQL